MWVLMHSGPHVRCECDFGTLWQIMFKVGEHVMKLSPEQNHPPILNLHGWILFYFILFFCHGTAHRAWWLGVQSWTELSWGRLSTPTLLGTPACSSMVHVNTCSLGTGPRLPRALRWPCVCVSANLHQGLISTLRGNPVLFSWLIWKTIWPFASSEWI